MYVTDSNAMEGEGGVGVVWTEAAQRAYLVHPMPFNAAVDHVDGVPEGHHEDGKRHHSSFKPEHNEDGRAVFPHNVSKHAQGN